jgi:hypothetical protein
VPTSQLGPNAHVFFVFGGATLGIAGHESADRLFTVRSNGLLFQTYRQLSNDFPPKSAVNVGPSGRTKEFRGRGVLLSLKSQKDDGVKPKRAAVTSTSNIDMNTAKEERCGSCKNGVGSCVILFAIYGFFYYKKLKQNALGILLISSSSVCVAMSGSDRHHSKGCHIPKTCQQKKV